MYDRVEPGLNLKKIPFVEGIYKSSGRKAAKTGIWFRTAKAGMNTQYSRSSATGR
jgi:hypothetical protein